MHLHNFVFSLEITLFEPFHEFDIRPRLSRGIDAQSETSDAAVISIADQIK